MFYLRHLPRRSPQLVHHWIRPTMKTEIESATKFLVELMKTGSSQCSKLTEEQLHRFRLTVVECLTNYYADHWFPEHPVKGSGYRCIRINGKVDPILVKAGHLMGLAAQFLHSMFPSEFTMWVDPHEVSYRIGENGSICVLYETADNYSYRSAPSPPTTPPSKKIRGSPEPPSTPTKVLPTLCQQVTPPPQALSYQQHFSPSNTRRASPHHQFQFIQHHHLAFLKENSSNNNCKDIAMRSSNHVLPLERLFVSS